jgi:hypothetical protein
VLFGAFLFFFFFFFFLFPFTLAPLKFESTRPGRYAEEDYFILKMKMTADEEGYV